MSNKNKLLEFIIDSLYNVDGWKEFSVLTLENKELDFNVWIGNMPIFDTNLHPEPIKLSLFEKYRLWRASMFCIDELRNIKLREKIDKIITP